MVKDKYNVIGELFDSLLRGNEIEFQYDERCYYILPNFSGKDVISVCLGEANTEKEVICTSQEELYNACIGDTILGEIIFQIDTTWKNF